MTETFMGPQKATISVTSHQYPFSSAKLDKIWTRILAGNSDCWKMTSL